MNISRSAEPLLLGLGSANALNLVGRPPQGTMDICGEYTKAGSYQGYPKYEKVGSALCIHFSADSSRWVLDLSGTSNQVYAYAPGKSSHADPVESLSWHVWEESRQCHVVDPALMLTTAPATIQVCGRDQALDNGTMNGEYKLCGMHLGKLAYKKCGTTHVIRFWAPKQRWVLDLNGLRDEQDGDICNAWADGRDALIHPGNASLVWHVWEQNRNQFMIDNSLKTMAAPAVVTVFGCEYQKQSSIINGTYKIHSAKDGKPFYVSDSTGLTIQYCSENDHWGIASSNAAGESYIALAEANGTKHPGYLDLAWSLWDSSRNQHIADDAVRTTIAPGSVEIVGRDPTKENNELLGVYHIVSTVHGRQAYQKQGDKQVIRYWPPEDRWLIDTNHGFDGDNVVNAFADACKADHPGTRSLVWHVWDSQVGRHVKDDNMTCIVLPVRENSKVPEVASTNHGVKRTIDQVATENQATSVNLAVQTKVQQPSRIPMPFGMSIGMPSFFRNGSRGGGA